MARYMATVGACCQGCLLHAPLSLLAAKFQEVQFGFEFRIPSPPGGPILRVQNRESRVQNILRAVSLFCPSCILAAARTAHHHQYRYVRFCRSIVDDGYSFNPISIISYHIIRPVGHISAAFLLIIDALS